MNQQNFTADELLTAIRDADSLDELRKMIGHASLARTFVSLHLAALNRLSRTHGPDLGTWPQDALDSHSFHSKAYRDFSKQALLGRTA
ncbi:hypothetical protein ACUHMQ_18110 [Chitinimonas sp. PSY-7]|uniref:hypothetical protein n=1 Tax=Chitinimonas sp. PSY-7 TaxID=3459088 RepID=UPI00403FC8C4